MIVYRVGIPRDGVKFGRGPFTMNFDPGFARHTFTAEMKKFVSTVDPIDLMHMSFVQFTRCYLVYAGVDRSEIDDHYGLEHPSVFSDVRSFVFGDLCGVASRKQLNHWFRARFREVLSNLGVVLYEIEVPDASVKVGEFQVAFNKHDARLIGTPELSWEKFGGMPF